MAFKRKDFKTLSSSNNKESKAAAKKKREIELTENMLIVAEEILKQLEYPEYFSEIQTAILENTREWMHRQCIKHRKKLYKLTGKLRYVLFRDKSCENRGLPDCNECPKRCNCLLYSDIA